jgi:hypothetical protein
VACERQAEPLNRIGDEAGRPVIAARRLERIEQGGQIMTAEIGHQRAKLGVGATLEQRCDAWLAAYVGKQALAPGGAALEGERRVKLVGTGVDPGAQCFAAGFGESGLL